MCRRAGTLYRTSCALLPGGPKRESDETAIELSPIIRAANHVRPVVNHYETNGVSRTYHKTKCSFNATAPAEFCARLWGSEPGATIVRRCLSPALTLT